MHLLHTTERGFYQMNLSYKLGRVFSAEASLCVLTFLFFMYAPPASSASVFGEVKPWQWGPIEVSLNDGARDGCWTNLRDSKAYAVEKLSAMGFDVVENNDFGGFVFEIFVNAFRLNNGLCVGLVDLQIYKPMTDPSGQFGFFLAAVAGGVFTNYRNGNDYVMENISRLMDKMRAELM